MLANDGEAQDYAEAMKWLRRAAQDGSLDAKNLLAIDLVDLDPSTNAVYDPPTPEMRKALGLDGVTASATPTPTGPNPFDQFDGQPPATDLSPPANGLQAATTNSVPGTPGAGATEISLEDDGGTFVVPVLINSAITLKFTVDSGSADVTIPADVFSTLVRTGTIENSDMLETRTYTLADGSTKDSQTFRIRSLTVGGLILQNVMGSVSNANGVLLLGQTFLKSFKSWSIDNSRKVLVLVPN